MKILTKDDILELLTGLFSGVLTLYLLINFGG